MAKFHYQILPGYPAHKNFPLSVQEQCIATLKLFFFGIICYLLCTSKKFRSKSASSNGPRGQQGLFLYLKTKQREGKNQERSVQQNRIKSSVSWSAKPTLPHTGSQLLRNDAKRCNCKQQTHAEASPRATQLKQKPRSPRFPGALAM